MSKRVEKIAQQSRIVWVPIAEMYVDQEAYQRPFDARWVKERSPNFDAEKLGLITLNKRNNGKYSVIDGQHRKALMEAVGWSDQKAQSRVYEGLTIAEEAAMFLSLNDMRPVRSFNKFRAAVRSGESASCEINKIVANHGLVISDQGTDGHITAIKSLERIYAGAGVSSAKEGPPALERTIGANLKAWGPQISSFQHGVVGGMGLVQLRYNGAIDQTALVSKLSSIPGGAPGLLGKARALQDVTGRPLPHCVASLIVQIYNKGRSKGKLERWES